MNRRSAPSLFVAIILLAVFGVGCASFPHSTIDRSTPAGDALLAAAARAHGIDTYRALNDINVSYAGEWFGFVQRLQPALVDSAFRGRSEERILVRERSIAQTHTGPKGVKQVWAPANNQDIRVLYNDALERDAEKRAAASLVTDGYRLFLLGPIFLAERNAIVEALGTEIVNGVRCDVLDARIRPGIGWSSEERIKLWVGAEDRLARRIWLSVEGLPSTRGAIAEVDLFDYIEHAGMRWPTRFFERLLRPLPIDIHDWRLTGLDVDRRYGSEQISGPSFTDSAAIPARRIHRGSAHQ
jgi:hypothetical protein